jgi:hypothetical protein
MGQSIDSGHRKQKMQHNLKKLLDVYGDASDKKSKESNDSAFA